MARTEKEIVMRYVGMKFLVEDCDDFAREYTQQEKIALAYQVICSADYSRNMLTLKFPEYIGTELSLYFDSVKYDEESGEFYANTYYYDSADDSEIDVTFVIGIY